MNVTKKRTGKIMQDVFSLVRDHMTHDVRRGLDNFQWLWLCAYKLWANVFRTRGAYVIDTTSTAESYHNFIKSLAREVENSRWLKQRRMDVFLSIGCRTVSVRN